MEDAGVHPTLYMYQNVLPYIWRENGMDFAATMQEKISMILPTLIIISRRLNLSCNNIFWYLLFCFCFDELAYITSPIGCPNKPKPKFEFSNLILKLIFKYFNVVLF